MNYKVLTLKDKAEWNKYFDRLPQDQQDVYFTPEYYSLYENYGDGDALCFIYEQGDEIIIYPFLKSIINGINFDLDKNYYDIQGAYGYNGIASSTNNNQIIKCFWNAFEKYCHENDIVAEFTRFHPILKNYQLAGENTIVVFDRHTVYLDLSPDEELLLSRVKKSTRKDIRRADSFIKTLIASDDPKDIQIFNDIYNENMIRVNSTDYLFFNKAYFEELFKLKGFVAYIAYINGEPVACFSGIICNNYCANFLSASKGEANSSGVNAYLYWKMITYAKKQGCRYIHFGGGTSSDLNNSLLNYKLNYSSTMADFYIGKTIHNKEIYDQLCNKWEEQHSEIKEQYKRYFLKYRVK